MAAKTQGKGKDTGPSKYVTSADCEKCPTKCPKGKAHLSKLKAKHISNCPMCPIKK